MPASVLPLVVFIFLSMTSVHALGDTHDASDLEVDRSAADIKRTLPKLGKPGNAPMAVGGGGGGGGGTPLDFNVSIFEPQIPNRYPGTTALGDGYNPATGEITFSVVDISIPGNSAIPVELRRWIPTNDSDTGGPTGWKWDIPHIKGNYLDMKPGHSDSGWDWGTSTWHNGDNCTGDSDSVLTAQDNLIVSNMYWEGKLLHIPDVTSEKLLKETNPSTPYEETTKSNFVVDYANCIDNPSGQEGTVVDAPNGLTYTFNHIKSYFNGKDTLKDPNTMTRILLVTKIEDRFGNNVVYSYDASSNLTQILASDGRKIVITYATVSGKKRPTTAKVDNTSPTADRVWTYNYQASGGKYLESVTLPDGSEWEYTGLDVFDYDPNDPIGVYSYGINRYPGGGARWAPGCGASATNQYASVKTPSGATIDYIFRETFHNRSDVEPAIVWNAQSNYDGQARNLHCTVSLSLTQRTVSGPGFADLQWTYSYSQNQGTYTAASGMNGYLTGPFDISAPSYGFPSMINSSTDVNFRTTTINGPERKSVYYIDRKFQSPTEGMVLVEEILTPSSNTLLERQEKTFVKGAFVGNHWYKCPCGGDYPPSSAINANQTNYRINQTERDAIRYSGGLTDTYTTAYANFDTYGFATRVSESNDFSGNVRYTLRTFTHDATNWLLGLPAKTQVANTSALFSSPGSYPVVNETTYYTAGHSYKSSPQYEYRFGRLYKTNNSYHVTGLQKGLPNRVTYNATNRWVEFSNYKRGIAQTVKTPQSLSTSPQYAYKTVDDNGWITQLTDFNGNTTNATYDSRGRLTLIDPVNASWANTTISYPTTSGSEGLAYIESGMPKMITTRGNSKVTVYFDALWRSRLTKSEDTGNSLVRFTRTAYDAGSNPVFQSHPVTAAAYVGDTANGVVTDYDALDRVIEVDENTTAGSITYSYLDANKVQVNDNKGNVTTTTYQAFGSPDQSTPLSIVAPASVTTTMAYNIYGNMTSAAQGGITEYRVYDGYQQLCKSVRPDVGNTAYVFDAIGNLTWKASGSSVSSSTGSCDTSVSASAKIDYTYDNLGNIRTVNFGDSSPDKTYTYDPNSNLTSLQAGGVTTSYSYNSRNLVEAESLTVDSQTFTLDYTYNSLGHLSSTIYPSSASIAYAPNAFGEAVQAGSYATAATYHPNGMVKSHNYGNGFAHTNTQTAAGLPNTWYDVRSSTYAINYGFSYDANSNITFWDDKVNNAYDMQATYDGMDRLDTLPDSYDGVGNVNYDPMGNITYYQLGSRTLSYTYNGNKQLTSATGHKSYSFTYDDRGNVTNNGTRAFTYNAANQMVTSGGYSYLYDGNDKRVKQVDGHGTSYSFYAGNGKLMYRKEGSSHVDYYYLGGKLVAKKKGSTVTYLHGDYLGSSSAESNTSGTVTSRMHYRPFGEPIEAPAKDDVGYTGHKYDTDLGLSYMQARYFDPVVGRFMAADPVVFSSAEPQHFGRYHYANNNPFKYVDPDGNDAVGISAGISVTEMGAKTSIQYSLVLDGSGNFAIQQTVEVGAGLGSARSLFANAVASNADSVDAMEGVGLATSISAEVLNGATTMGIGSALSGDVVSNGVTTIELGVSLPLGPSTPEGGVTASQTTTLYKSGSFGGPGAWLGRKIYEFVHGKRDDRLIMQ